jgi:peptidoglycan/LPS O-acetylase OafA/YrhL
MPETLPVDPRPADETSSALLPDPTIPGPSSRHVPALDGLRGVAILGVMLFHCSLLLPWTSPLNSWLAGWPQIGWLGVDVFFVLSGFLITGILLDTRGGQRYFVNFYARRVLRIMPVYYLLLAIIFFVLPRFVPFESEPLRTLQARQAWLWTHLTNLGFVYHRKVWALADWLDLVHLWSLAVEEQFYLVWPLVVHVLGPRRLRIACLCCIAGSVVLRLGLWQADQRPGAIYFPTPCRLDGLALGAWVAAAMRERDAAATMRTLARRGVWVAAALLAGLAVWRGGLEFSDRPVIVFGVLATGVLTACVVAQIAEPAAGGPWVRILEQPLLRAAGKYSYGMYLYHNLLYGPVARLAPVASLQAWAGSELAGNLVFMAIFVTACFGTAFLSWHAYEKHWLAYKRWFDSRPQSNPGAADARRATGA